MSDSLGFNFNGIPLLRASRSLQQITRFNATGIWPHYRNMLEVVVDFNSYSDQNSKL